MVVCYIYSMVNRRQLLIQLSGLGSVFIAGCSAPTQDGNHTEPHKVPISPEETEFELKKQVYDKYDIGACFGMPSVVSEEQMIDVVDSNPSLVNKLQDAYSVTETRELYEMINQFNQISITEIGTETVDYTVKDGDCCTIYTYSGVIVGEDVREESVSVESVPC